LFESASSWMLCSIHHQLSQSTTRNQKDIILHHFRKECNCNTNFPEHDTKPKRHYPASFPERMQLQNQVFQSTTRNQKDIILHHFRKECNYTTNFSRARHETKKTLSCIISGKNAIAPPTFPEYDTKPKRHYPASFPERMQLQHQLSRARHETKNTLCSIRVCLNLHLPGCYVQ
jgi:hypothetical protein